MHVSTLIVITCLRVYPQQSDKVDQRKEFLRCWVQSDAGQLAASLH